MQKCTPSNKLHWNDVFEICWFHNLSAVFYGILYQDVWSFRYFFETCIELYLVSETLIIPFFLVELIWPG